MLTKEEAHDLDLAVADLREVGTFTDSTAAKLRAAILRCAQPTTIGCALCGKDVDEVDRVMISAATGNGICGSCAARAFALATSQLPPLVMHVRRPQPTVEVVGKVDSRGVRHHPECNDSYCTGGC